MRAAWYGCLVLAGGVLGAVPLPAAGQQDDIAICTNLDGRNWDAKIAGCTRALRNSSLSSSDIAKFSNARGFWYHQKSDYNRAIADYSEALRHDQSNERAVVYSNRANSWHAKGDYEKALADHNQAVRLQPDSVAARANRSASLREKGDLDRALVDLEHAIRLAPNLPNPYGQRGLVYRAKGDLDRALADYNQVLRLNPKSVFAYTNRGLVYEERGDIERARKDFKTASELPIQSVIDREKRLLDIEGPRHHKTARVRLALLSEVQEAPGAKPAKSAQPPSPRRAEEPGRRVALVIGNGRYVSAGALPNPPNDARAVARTLQQVGFEVTQSIDLNATSMQTALRDFLLKASGARIAVVFYAGHGLQIDGRNYLVPIDATIADKASIAVDITDLDNILAGLDDQIRTNIVVLDACRDNPLAQEMARQAGASRSVVVRGGLAAPSGLGKGATRGAGTLIAFATAPGQVAFDGAGENSPFSTALTRHLSTPGLEVQQMLTRVRAEVVSATNGKQVPWSNSSLLGEVYLVGKP